MFNIKKEADFARNNFRKGSVKRPNYAYAFVLVEQRRPEEARGKLRILTMKAF